MMYCVSPAKWSGAAGDCSAQFAAAWLRAYLGSAGSPTWENKARTRDRKVCRTWSAGTFHGLWEKRGDSHQALHLQEEILKISTNHFKSNNQRTNHDEMHLHVTEQREPAAGTATGAPPLPPPPTTAAGPPPTSIWELGIVIQFICVCSTPEGECQ